MPSPLRSLADDIRQRSDAQLADLVRRRPDLARPAPADLTALASRASTRASVQRAVDALDRGRLQVLESVVWLAAPATAASVAPLAAAGEAEVVPALEDLWAAALLWRSPEGLVPVRTAGEVLGPIAGLGPTWFELGERSGIADPEQIRAALAQAPEAARAIARRLTWGPPSGSVGDGPLSAAEGVAAEGARWLVGHGLAVVTGASEITLPGEVGLALRDGLLHRSAELHAPRVQTRALDADLADRVAGGQVTELIGLVDELAASWGVQSPRVLRTGGLAVRDQRLLAALLDVEPDRAAFVAELAYAAGLVDDDGALDPVWAPTAAYDDWESEPGSIQWARLARAWLASTRAPHLVGRPVEGGTGSANALGPDVVWPPIRSLRRAILDELESLPEGASPSREGLIERLRWRHPRRLPVTVEDLVAVVLREAEWLGITGRGALSRAGRALLDGSEGAELAATMQPHLPAPVEHVLLQGDLTAIAPGPLTGRLAQFMRLVADIESRGGATVYRFRAETIRRALDAGWSADQILDGLRDGSQTPVPQPLDYLVRDAARRHGQTRVGAAAAYIRSDDEAALGAMEAARELAPLQLRRIAPTVLVTNVHPQTALELLRDNGFAPVLESAAGGVVVPPPTAHRALTRRRHSDLLHHQVDEGYAASLVTALRAADEEEQARAEHTADTPEETDPITVLALLREAAAERHGVWVGYSNNLGQVRRMLFYPERVEGGRAHGVVDGTRQTLSVHRITGAALD
ncbi:MAG: helicase-associated domain-containing protein [Micrococcales bacterium]|nr:helicase-associated domain-containing protein [Micrococcales bacterium]